MAAAVGVNLNGERAAGGLALIDRANIPGFLNGHAKEKWSAEMAGKTNSSAGAMDSSSASGKQELPERMESGTITMGMPTTMNSMPTMDSTNSADRPDPFKALLSRSGGFVVCDAKVCPATKRLPIHFASEAFLDMLGYDDIMECAGQSWIDVLSGACDSQVGCWDAVAKASGLPRHIAAAAVEALSVHFQKVVSGLRAARGGTASAFALARRSCGEVFVCELTMMVHTHRLEGKPCIVGLHHDLSKEVSVVQLLGAVTSGCEDLAAAVGVNLNGERAAEGLALIDRANIPGFLNGHAKEKWSAEMAGKMAGGNLDEKEVAMI